MLGRNGVNTPFRRQGHEIYVVLIGRKTATSSFFIMSNASKGLGFLTFTSAAALAAVASFSSTPQPAQAALFNTCKNVRITIRNSTSLPIEARYLRVYDHHGQDWDTEQLVNKKIIPGQSYTYTENLADVGGKEFTLTPYYRSLRQTSSGAKWTSTQAGSSRRFSRCSNGGSYTLSI